MSTLTVRPRDLQPGDSLTQVNDDFDIVEVAIERVEKIRRDRRTAYRVHLVGNDEPITFTPATEVTIERKEQGA